MAVSYKGLIIKFGGDTTNLQAALKTIQTETRKTNADLREINNSLKFNPGNTELLEQKVRALNKAYDDTKAKLDAYKDAMATLEDKKQRGEQLTEEESRQYDSLYRNIQKCEGQLETFNEDLKKTATEAEASKTNIYEFGQELENNRDKFELIGQKMQGVGDAATKYVTVPLAGIGVAAGKAAVDMDTAMTGVRKTVDGTAEDYENLKNAALEFSQTNAVSATQLLDIEALGAQLGYTLDVMSNGKTEVQEFGEVVSGLEIATNMDAEQAGTELAQFANITKMSKEETSNYGSTIVALGNNLATTESDVSSMAQRLAAAGHQVGMSEADIMGLAGALTSMGMEAAAGGSAMSTIMSDIDKTVAMSTEQVKVFADQAGMSTDEFITKLRESPKEFESLARANGMTLKQFQNDVLGSYESLDGWASAAKMDAKEFAEAWKKDPVEAFSAVIAGMEDASTEGSNLSLMLEDLGISELRQTDAMKRLAGNSQVLTDAVDLANTAWEENTALGTEVASKNDSMAAKFEMLKNKVTAILTEVGGPLVDAVLDAIDAAEPFIKAIGDAAKAFSEMDEGQQRMILGLAGAAAAFGPVTSGLGGLIGNLGNIGTGFKNAATAWTNFKGGLAGVETATGGFATLGAKVSGVGTAISGGLSSAWTGFTGLIAAHPIALGIAAVAAAVAGLTWFFTQTEEGKKLWTQFTGWISEKWQAVQDFFAGVPAFWSGIWDSVGTKIDEVKQTIGGAWDAIKTGVGEKIEAIKSGVGAAWDAVSTKTSEIFEGVKGFITDDMEAAKSAASHSAGALQAALSGDWGKAKDEAKAAFDAIKSRIQERMNIAKDLAVNAANAIGEKLGFPGLGDKVLGVFENIGNSIRDKIDAARDAVGNAIDAIKGFFSFDIQWPHIPLPHFYVSGSPNPLDWIEQGVPEIGIDWYAKGGAIAPNDPHLIGVGDATEREWIEPESKLLSLIQEAVRNVRGGNIAVEVNVSATVTGQQSAYQLGQNIGRGINSALKQQGVANA